jgi:hypothetical protein
VVRYSSKPARASSLGASAGVGTGSLVVAIG